MSRWTRRDLLKRALAATAGTVAANPLPATPDARAPLDASTRSGPAGFDQVGSSSRSSEDSRSAVHGVCADAETGKVKSE